MINFLTCDVYDRLLPARWQYGKERNRLEFGMAVTGTRKLRKILEDCEENALYWNREVYPQGERIKFGKDLAKFIRPIAQKLGYRTIKEYERALEAQSGNPPIDRKRLQRR